MKNDGVTCVKKKKAQLGLAFGSADSHDHNRRMVAAFRGDRGDDDGGIYYINLLPNLIIYEGCPPECMHT